MENEKLLQFIKRCGRTKKPDLHSFKIELKHGVAFVDCQDGAAVIDMFISDDKGNETHSIQSGSFLYAAEILLHHGAKIETIDM